MRSTREALFLHYADKRPDLNPKHLATLKDVKLMHDAYDTAVLYADYHIGRVIQALEQAGVLDETAIIISADHGECLGELNAYGGHCFADHNVAHVPLIIRWPGVTDSRANEHACGLHYHLDLAASVCDLLGIVTPSQWDAKSMADVLRGTSTPDHGRDALVISQLAQACQRAVRFRHDGRDFIYIRTYRSGKYELPSALLFDLTRDPHEERDLAMLRPELAEYARGLLDEWKGIMLANSLHEDPLKEVLNEPPGN
jgi:arylsulfatase A-like enzyme